MTRPMEKARPRNMANNLAKSCSALCVSFLSDKSNKLGQRQSLVVDATHMTHKYKSVH